MGDAPHHAVPMTPLPEGLPPVLAQRYRLEREVGAGGMATVYLAEDLKHHRQVAVKVIRPELAAIGPDRFLREVAIAARLNHPHILALHDSGSAAGSLYYVMPFVQGETLRHRLEREKQLPVEGAVRLTRQIAFALAYAHAQGVVHRDIKPENILLHEGEPMVADFGIALAVAAAEGERLTQVGLSLGTPAYMSPEQTFGDREIDGRSDVYSLACVLFELLVGEPPYTGVTAQAIMTKRLLGPVPSVRRLRPTVGIAVDAALRRALAPLLADRFPTAAAFAEALDAPEPDQPGVPVVAVLPFLSLSSDPDNEFFADGITEDVIAHLSKVRALDVISRASVMPFKKRERSIREMAAVLRAGTLLDGSVRRAANRVRVVAQLIDAETERQLWTETYDRELTDIFAIQTDVALHIASALRAELSPEEQSRIREPSASDLQAYELYLQGRHSLQRFTEEGLLQAVRLFERAIAKDPRYALAYTGMAMAYLELGANVEPGIAYPRAKEAITAALALDEGLADAHCMLGHLKFVWEFDWVGAEAAFNRALALRPGHADVYDLYGRMCTALERFDEGVAMQRRARELDPLAHPTDYANALLRAGRYDEAIAAARTVVENDPESDRGQATLGWAYLKQGQVAEGLAHLERAVALSPESPQWLAQLGQALAGTGHQERAREIAGQLEAMSRLRYVSPYHRAFVYAGLGEDDTAIDWLERAYQERAGAIYGVKGSFLFASLRWHPRFVALLEKMNLA
jgi:eukaryotic-like serine/threonine-protein kinase